MRHRNVVTGRSKTERTTKATALSTGSGKTYEAPKNNKKHLTVDRDTRRGAVVAAAGARGRNQANKEKT